MSWAQKKPDLCAIAKRARARERVRERNERKGLNRAVLISEQKEKLMRRPGLAYN